jgi:hypothetical protein
MWNSFNYKLKLAEQLIDICSPLFSNLFNMKTSCYKNMTEFVEIIVDDFLKVLVFYEISGTSRYAMALRPWVISCLKQVVHFTYGLNMMGFTFL